MITVYMSNFKSDFPSILLPKEEQLLQEKLHDSETKFLLDLEVKFIIKLLSLIQKFYS